MPKRHKPSEKTKRLRAISLKLYQKKCRKIWWKNHLFFFPNISPVIMLKKGLVVFVDEGDLSNLKKHTWTWNGRYVVTNARDGKTIYMHRYILGLKERRQDAHHEDENPRNNRRYNLIEMPHSEHQRLHGRDHALERWAA